MLCGAERGQQDGQEAEAEETAPEDAGEATGHHAGLSQGGQDTPQHHHQGRAMRFLPLIFFLAGCELLWMPQCTTNCNQAAQRSVGVGAGEANE